MKRTLKFIGFFFGFLLILVILAILSIYALTEEKLSRVYPVSPSSIHVPGDQVSLDRGRHLVNSVLFCGDCHMDDFGGTVYDEGPLVGMIGVKNLTNGAGGIGAEFSIEDWVRAIRHGIGREGRTLIDMPSQAYYYLSDEDLAAVIAYLRSIKPVDREIPETQVGLLARVFLLQFPELLPATVIDHDAPRPVSPEPGLTVEYGSYLANSCRICHEADLAGASEPGAGMNLTPGGNLSHWTQDQFIKSLRTGETPEGKRLDAELMPWPKISGMTDEELGAIWLYLQTLPSVETKTP